MYRNLLKAFALRPYTIERDDLIDIMQLLSNCYKNLDDDTKAYLDRW